MNLKTVILFATMMITKSAFPQLSVDFENEVKKQTVAMTVLCKYLHQNPELSLQEFETSKKMATELRKGYVIFWLALIST